MESYTKLTDEQLVRLYADGDNKAFEYLLMRHKDRLYAFIHNLTHEQHLTDDLFQETFMKVIINIKEDRYTENGRFFSWASTIARNLFIDHQRDETNKNTVSDDANEISLFDNIKLYERELQDSISYEHMLQSIEQLLEELPESQREIVVMRYYQKLPFKEIATRQDISINTALGRFHYAIQNLKKLAISHNITCDSEAAY